MSAEQQRLGELWDLRSRVALLHWSVGKVSPAAAELLKAVERVLVEEGEIAHKIVMAQRPGEIKQ